MSKKKKPAREENLNPGVEEIMEDKTEVNKEKRENPSTEANIPGNSDSDIIYEEKLKEKEDKYLRLAAEFDNYRKRTLKEKAELIKIAGADMISDLLPVIDDVDRAVGSINSSSDIESVKKGINLIHTKFHDFLNRKGVKEIKAIGEEFDTDHHEAITRIPAPSKKEIGKIVDITEKGYMLHDRIIRYAKVIVGE